MASSASRGGRRWWPTRTRRRRRVRGLADGERVVRRVLHVGRHRPVRTASAPAHSEARSAPLYAAITPGIASGRRQRRRGDAGVRVRTAQHGEVQRAGDVQVVGELGLAGEQGGIFAAQQPLAQDRSGPVFGDGHDHSLGVGVSYLRRRPARPARCCDSPCSGTGFPRDRGAPRARSDSGSPSTGWSPP